MFALTEPVHKIYLEKLLRRLQVNWQSLCTMWQLLLNSTLLRNYKFQTGFRQ